MQPRKIPIAIGISSPQKYREYLTLRLRRTRRHDVLCKPLLSGMYIFSNTTAAWEAAVKAKMTRACAMKREEVNEKCFDGGNPGHREATTNAWRSVKKCLDMIP